MVCGGVLLSFRSENPELIIASEIGPSDPKVGRRARQQRIMSGVL